MNQEKQRESYQKMLKKCPDILTPMKAARWSPVGKNSIYAALKNGEIESYTYKGGYIFTKDAFIDYLVKTTNDKGRGYTIRGDKKC
ncbi:MAG: helix-turn-helix domain-containing protein [Ruminococcaceae bacterium]|nr:helix-turn-helix domain-containing protein [Oscillospiraceae bacterium]